MNVFMHDLGETPEIVGLGSSSFASYLSFVGTNCS